MGDGCPGVTVPFRPFGPWERREGGCGEQAVLADCKHGQCKGVVELIDLFFFFFICWFSKVNLLKKLRLGESVNGRFLFLLLIGALRGGTNSPCVPFLLRSRSLELCLGGSAQLPNGCLLSKKSASKEPFLLLPASGSEWHQFWEGAGGCDRSFGSLCATPEHLGSPPDPLLLLSPPVPAEIRGCPSGRTPGASRRGANPTRRHAPNSFYVALGGKQEAGWKVGNY